MKINLRMRRTTKQYIVVAIICIVIIGGASLLTTIFVARQIRNEYDTLLTEVENDKRQNQRFAYVAMNDIAAGEVITDQNVKRITVYSSQPQGSFITGSEIGQLALIDIPSDTQLIKTMLTEKKVSSELREIEYQVLHISANIVSNDTIDVRIVFPNGESMVVLSKKVIKGITEGSVVCYLWLDPQEILRMSAAIVDAALYPGTQLITTKYIEPSIQEASAITYIPGLSILELLETDPNILERSSQELAREVRKALENRLANSMSTDVSEINWDINPYKQKELSLDSDKKKTETDNSEEVNTRKDKSKESMEGADAEEDVGEAEELGSVHSDYFYYVEEQEAKDGVVEYGE